MRPFVCVFALLLAVLVAGCAQSLTGDRSGRCEETHDYQCSGLVQDPANGDWIPAATAGDLLVHYCKQNGKWTQQCRMYQTGQTPGTRATGTTWWRWLVGHWGEQPLQRSIAGAPGTAAILWRGQNSAGQPVDRIIALYDTAMGKKSEVDVWVGTGSTANRNPDVRLFCFDSAFMSYVDVTDQGVGTVRKFQIWWPLTDPDDIAAQTAVQQALPLLQGMSADRPFPPPRTMRPLP